MWFCVSFFECGFAFLFLKWFCVSFFEEYMYKSCYNACHSSIVHPSFSVMHYTSYQKTRFIPYTEAFLHMICNQFLEDALCFHVIPIALLQRHNYDKLFELK